MVSDKTPRKVLVVELLGPDQAKPTGEDPVKVLGRIDEAPGFADVAQLAYINETSKKLDEALAIVGNETFGKRSMGEFRNFLGRSTESGQRSGPHPHREENGPDSESP